MEEENKQNNSGLNDSVDFKDLQSLPLKRLIELAEDRVEKCEMVDASVFFEEAVKKDPDNDETLLSYGEFLKQWDEVEKAEFVFLRSIQLHPEKNIKKYFQLAELRAGQESLQLYEKGIELLEKNITQLQKEETKDLCNAYAAIAELYQTDFVQFKESEAKVTENIEKALKLDPENLDAKLQLANYFLNKEDSEKAKEPLLFIYQNLKLEEENINMIQGNQEQQQQPLNDNITQSFKVNVAKLLMEVECYAQSLAVLEHLTFLDSDNKEHLYLLAFVNFKMQNYYHALEQCEELLAKKFESDEDLDQEILVAAKELKTELDKTDFKLSKDHIAEDADEKQIEQIKQLVQQATGGIDENEEDDWVDMDEEN